MPPGSRGKITAPQFLAAKVALAIGGLVFGLLAGAASSGVTALLLPLGLLARAAASSSRGCSSPSRTRKRRGSLRAQLPDALDLLAVSVEAGLGFDGAVTKLTEHMDGALTEEFPSTLGEMRIGESPLGGAQEAGRALRRSRSSLPSAAPIIQADQLGISLGRILRVQATDTRLRRQAAAEERAMKAPIKMLFPTVAVHLPGDVPRRARAGDAST